MRLKALHPEEHLLKHIALTSLHHLARTLETDGLHALHAEVPIDARLMSLLDNDDLTLVRTREAVVLVNRSVVIVNEVRVRSPVYERRHGRSTVSRVVNVHGEALQAAMNRDSRQVEVADHGNAHRTRMLSSDFHRTRNALIDELHRPNKLRTG